MNPRTRKFAVVISAVLLNLVIGVSAQVGPSPFSADMSAKDKDGQRMLGKFYFSGQKLRIDLNTEGGQMGMIHDIAAKVTYLLMTQQRMYMEMHTEKSPMMRRAPDIRNLKSFDPENPCASQTDTTCEKVGSETVDGRSTDKWIFTSKKTGEASTVWIDKKLHFPIKTQDKDGSEMEFTNIKEGAPSPSLFEIPAGYRKLDPAMMGGRTPQ